MLSDAASTKAKNLSCFFGIGSFFLANTMTLFFPSGAPISACGLRTIYLPRIKVIQLLQLQDTISGLLRHCELQFALPLDDRRNRYIKKIKNKFVHIKKPKYDLSPITCSHEALSSLPFSLYLLPLLLFLSLLAFHELLAFSPS